MSRDSYPLGRPPDWEQRELPHPRARFAPDRTPPKGPGWNPTGRTPTPIPDNPQTVLREPTY